jgi:hypothetical protein
MKERGARYKHQIPTHFSRIPPRKHKKEAPPPEGGEELLRKEK